MFNFTGNQGNKTLSDHELYFTRQIGKKKKKDLVLNVTEGVWKWGLWATVGDHANWHSRLEGQVHLLANPPEKVLVYKDACVEMFTAELFRRVNTWRGASGWLS